MKIDYTFNIGGMMPKTYTLIILLLLLSACSDDSTKRTTQPLSNESVEVDNSISNISIPDNRFANTYQVLLFGNSHVLNLEELLKIIIKTANPRAEVSTFNAGGGFLDNKLKEQSRTDILHSKPWTHVILQGQKYSQSGVNSYPTIDAKNWIIKAKKQKTTPVLFPEHPQKGETKEGRRVHNIHIGIAEQQSSCVAPIGLAWDKVIMTVPQLNLHINDGNHASLQGRFLTTLVLYEVITGEPADLLPFIEDINIQEDTQQLLKQMASEVIQANQPCKF